VKAFLNKHALQENGVTGLETWPVKAPYTIIEEDAAGPFEKIPQDMQAKAKQKALNYESALEGLAEKFHCSPQTLGALDPGKRFDRPGETILAMFLPLTVIPLKRQAYPASLYRRAWLRPNWSTGCSRAIQCIQSFPVPACRESRSAAWRGKSRRHPRDY